MLSRVADNLYWMSRYMERAENLARLMLVSTEMLLDSSALGRRARGEYWMPVLVATAMEGAFAELYPRPGASDVARFFALDARNPDSILSCVRQARENARTVRDQISDEMWTELNALHLFVGSGEGREMHERSPQAFYEKVIQSSLLFDGITMATLSRTEGWQFLQLGRYLERADKTSRFLDIRRQTVEELDALQQIQGSTILRACSAAAAFRRIYGTDFGDANILEFLLLSIEFPRSVRFCVRAVDDVLHQISGTPTGQYSNGAEKVTGALLAKLNFAGVQEVLDRGVHSYIDDLQTALNAAGQEIFEKYVLMPREANRLARVPGFDASGYQALVERQQQQQQQQQRRSKGMRGR